MKPPRRRFLHLAAGAAALPAVSRIARAQAYPTRPVRVIVPFAPAGGSDITARLIGQWLSERRRRCLSAGGAVAANSLIPGPARVCVSRAVCSARSR
jgi:tripartite-type tricarboxylate transporter receptor subunit TctC